MTSNVSQCTASSWNALSGLQFVDGWYRTSVQFICKYGNCKSIVHIYGNLHWQYEYEDDTWYIDSRYTYICVLTAGNLCEFLHSTALCINLTVT